MSNKEIPGIVGLRAISSIMICFYHGFVWSDTIAIANNIPILSGIILKFFLAVEIFLVIAGFLSAQSLYRSCLNGDVTMKIK